MFFFLEAYNLYLCFISDLKKFG